MANLVCNIAKGRVAELYNRVDLSDPAAARLYVIPIDAGAVTDLVVCYASVASPTNAQLLPLTVHDFAITPDGSDVTALVADFYRAS